MELRHYISLIARWLWLMVAAVLIAAAGSYIASKRVAPLYRTKTTLIVGRVTESLDVTNLDLWTGEQLAATYAEMAEREPVLRGVVERLSLDVDWRRLAGQVSAAAIPQSLFLEISVVDTNPQRAKVLADAVAQQLILISPSNPSGIGQEEAEFARQEIAELKADIPAAREEVDQLQAELDAAISARRIQELENQIAVLESKISAWQSTYAQLLYSLQGGEVNTLTIVEEAAVPSAPISPNVRMNVVLASAVALVIAGAGALLVEYLDDTLKSAEDVTKATDLPTLAGIARIPGDTYPERLITRREPLSPVVEAYRVLRTNIHFSSVDKPLRTVMVTSSGPTEGKSVTLANLAVVMAQSGRTVIAVDSDLRRPVLHRAFDLSNNFGLSDLLLEQDPTLRDYLQETGVDNLHVIPSGTVPPNPAELLGSHRMEELVERLTEMADVVLFDSPPSLVVADSAILGTRVDGVILVCDTGKTRRAEAERAAAELRRVGANLLGAVLNRLPEHGGGYYYYAYRYYRESGTGREHHRRWWTRWIPAPLRRSRASRKGRTVDRRHESSDRGVSSDVPVLGQDADVSARAESTPPASAALASGALQPARAAEGAAPPGAPRGEQLALTGETVGAATPVEESGVSQRPGGRGGPPQGDLSPSTQAVATAAASNPGQADSRPPADSRQVGCPPARSTQGRFC